MLSIPQAAERLGISRQRAHQLVQSGKLKATRVGRSWVVEEEDVIALVGEKKEGRPEAA